MAPTWPKKVQDVCLGLFWAFIFGRLRRSPALPSLCLCFASVLLLLCICFAFAFRMGGAPLAVFLEYDYIVWMGSFGREESQTAMEDKPCRSDFHVGGYKCAHKGEGGGRFRPWVGERQF